MNKQSNTYTIIYISVMVVLVAFLLAFVAIYLKPTQQKNIAIDKMSQILNSVNIVSTPEDAEELYAQYIDDAFVINANGELIAGESFNMNIADQLKQPEAERTLPVFLFKKEGEADRYILPLWGAGLWGPLWGYIALEADGNKVYGAYFSHKGETPGLGAEIEKPEFQQQFKEKQLFTNGELTSIGVMKSGQKPQNGSDYVNAISGGTITSKGVENMLKDCILPYAKFLESLNSKNQ